MQYIVEYRFPGGEWQRWGSGNTQRTVEVSEAHCIHYLEDSDERQAETRVRKES